MPKYILHIILFFIAGLRMGYSQNVPNYAEKPSVKIAQPTPVYLAAPSARCKKFNAANTFAGYI